MEDRSVFESEVFAGVGGAVYYAGTALLMGGACVVLAKAATMAIAGKAVTAGVCLGLGAVATGHSAIKRTLKSSACILLATGARAVVVDAEVA